MPTTPIDLEGCREMLAEAEVLAVQIPKLRQRSQMLIQVAALLFQVGDKRDYARVISLFEDTVDAMDDDRQMDFALEPAVLRQAEIGDEAGARRTFARIHGSRDRARIYLGVGAAKSGRFEEAFQTFREMPIGYKQRTMLRTIAKEQADRGDLAGSLATLDQALTLDREDASARPPSHLLMDKAIVQARLGDLAGAIQTATPIVAGEQHEISLHKVAVICAEQGDLSLAQQAVSRIWDSRTRVEALCQIAQVLAGRGEDFSDLLHQARELSRDIGVSEDLVGTGTTAALTRLAETQASMGDAVGSRATLLQARRHVANISETFFQVGGLCKIAKAQADVNDDTGYQETISLAIQTTNNMPKKTDRKPYLEMIAMAQARARRTNDSYNTLALLPEVDGSPDWDGITAVHFAIGDLAGTIQAALAVPNLNRQCHHLTLAAEAQAKAGNIDGSRETLALVRDTIQYLSDPADKLQALLQIAKVQVMHTAER